MPQWIPLAIEALRSGSSEYADCSAERHDRSAECYRAQACGQSGGIQIDLLSLATLHEQAAERIRLAERRAA